MPQEVASYMALLMALSEDDLGQQLMASKMLLDGHYKQLAEANRN